MDFSAMLNKLKRDARSVSENDAVTPSAPKRAKQQYDTSSSTETTTKLSSNQLQQQQKQQQKQQQQKTKPFPQTKVSKIYLISPPNVRTGGPEAMHQLCDKINSMTIQCNHHHDNTPETNSTTSSSSVTAYLLYLEERHGTFRHITSAKPLKAYSNIYPHLKVASATWDQEPHDEQPSSSLLLLNSSQSKEDDYNDSILIWPEVWTHLIDTCKGNFQHAIWWLSVNNNNGKFTQWERQDILHLCQSEYAKQYITQHLNTTTGKVGIQSRVLSMTEYIPTRAVVSFHQKEDVDGGVQRDLQVLYNPLKGMHYTDEIRKRSDKKITFTPIGGGPDGRERISYEQVKAMLHRAMIYLDFGPHPGMDRLPREAALANCIVITNREGAAGFEEDVPIPEEYKIGDFNVERIHKLLMECIQSYEKKKQDFDAYRKWIGSQEEQMKKCVSEFIDVLVTKRV